MPFPIFRTSAPFLLSLLLFAGCRNEPGAENPGTKSPDSIAAQSPAVLPGADTNAVAAPGAVTGPDVAGRGNQTPAPPAVRTALVDSVRTFVDAVAAGHKERFWEMLSERSMSAVGTESGGTRDQVWQAARETLGELRRPSVRFIGGTADSVSLLIGRTRYEVVDPTRTDTLDDPVIIHFLRENGAWKAIYPGLLYPERDLRE